MMFRYIDALCLLPLYMYPKAHPREPTHVSAHTRDHAYTHVICFMSVTVVELIRCL